jgi:hypothetical protein
MDGDLAGRIERQRCLMEGLREILADIAEGVAQTEEKLADTLEQIAVQRGDLDGTRRKRAEKARQYAVYEREEAARLRSKRDVIPPEPVSAPEPPPSSDARPQHAQLT